MESRCDDHVKHLSPAKVNLFLKVVSKRPDGYHDLVSIVDIVSIYDVIRLRGGAGRRGVVRTTRRLASRRERQHDLPGDHAPQGAVSVSAGSRGCDVEKRIPMGSGLGGGSEQCGPVMKELVRLWSLPIETPELDGAGEADRGRRPSFPFGKPCVMRGVGNKMSPIELPVDLVFSRLSECRM